MNELHGQEELQGDSGNRGGLDLSAFAFDKGIKISPRRQLDEDVPGKR